MEFSGKSRLVRYPGVGGWHYLTINKTTTEKIKAATAGFRRGFGAVKVTGKIRKTNWITSIFPTKDKVYLLFVKKEVRKIEGINDGDMVSFKVILKHGI